MILFTQRLLSAISFRKIPYSIVIIFSVVCGCAVHQFALYGFVRVEINVSITLHKSTLLLIY